MVWNGSTSVHLIRIIARALPRTHYRASKNGSCAREPLALPVLVCRGRERGISGTHGASRPRATGKMMTNVDHLEALMQASSGRNGDDLVRVIQLLSNAGSDSVSIVNHSNAMGETPLILAVRAGCDRLVQLLLSASAEVRARDNCGASAMDYGFMPTN
jgi:hypothetical protein